MRELGLRVFLCPSDENVGPFASGATYVAGQFPPGVMAHTIFPINLAHAHHVGVFGSGPLTADGPAGDGVFFRDSRIRLADITDGTSTTLLVGERSSDLGLATWTGAVTRGRVEPRRPGSAPSSSADRAALVLGRASAEVGRGPNSPANRPEDFASRHPDGVQFAFGDGSVRFVANAIAPSAYAALATRAGGEVVPAP